MAILIGAIIPFLLGFLWYSPAMFGNVWVEAIGKKREELEPPIARHAIAIVGWLAASFVFAFLISHPDIQGIRDYIFLSFMLWGAFMMPAKATAIVQGNFNTKLLWIDGGYQLAGYLIMSFVFALFV